MNYQQRMAIVRKKIATFLKRYSPPRGFDEDAQGEAFKAICEATNRQMPSGINIEDRLDRVLEYVGDHHKTNAWPVQGTFAEAARKVGALHGIGKHPDIEDSVIERLANAFNEGGKCIRYLVTEELTRKVWDRHGFNLWNMRVAGFPMDKNLRKHMEETPKGKRCLDHHYRVLAKIWGCSIEEATARDRRNVERGTPDRVAIPDKRRVDDFDEKGY